MASFHSWLTIEPIQLFISFYLRDPRFNEWLARSHHCANQITNYLIRSPPYLNPLWRDKRFWHFWWSSCFRLQRSAVRFHWLAIFIYSHLVGKNKTLIKEVGICPPFFRIFVYRSSIYFLHKNLALISIGFFYFRIRNLMLCGRFSVWLVGNLWSKKGTHKKSKSAVNKKPQAKKGNQRSRREQ